jgi:hypothetical protein
MDLAKLDRLEREATAGKWTCDRRVTARGEPDHFAIERGDGAAILDTLNSEVAEIRTEYDEDGRAEWDEQGRKDLELTSALRNSARSLIDRAQKYDKLVAKVREFCQLDIEIVAAHDAVRPELIERMRAVIAELHTLGGE